MIEYLSFFKFFFSYKMEEISNLGLDFDFGSFESENRRKVFLEMNDLQMNWVLDVH